MHNNNVARRLEGLVGLNLLASLFHDAHNAAFFDAYPNEPAWLSPRAVDGLWFALAALAVAACLAYRRDRYAAARLSLLFHALLGLSAITCSHPRLPTRSP